LFALLYAAFGAASPLLPALTEAKGLSSEQIGMMFGAATAVRLLSAPVAGRIADRTHAPRATLAICCIACAITTLGISRLHTRDSSCNAGVVHTSTYPTLREIRGN